MVLVETRNQYVEIKNGKDEKKRIANKKNVINLS